MEEGQREDGTRNGGIDPAETRGSRDKGLPCVETLRHHSAIIPPTFFPPTIESRGPETPFPPSISLEKFFLSKRSSSLLKLTIFDGFKSLLIRVFFPLNLYIYVFENWITFKLILNLNNFDRSTFFSKSCKLTLRLNLSSFLHWSPFKVNSYFHPILNLEFHISCTVLISIFLLHSLYDSSVVPLAHRFSSFFLPFEEHEDTPLLDSISF